MFSLEWRCFLRLHLEKHWTNNFHEVSWIKVGARGVMEDWNEGVEALLHNVKNYGCLTLCCGWNWQCFGRNSKYLQDLSIGRSVESICTETMEILNYFMWYFWGGGGGDKYQILKFLEPPPIARPLFSRHHHLEPLQHLIRYIFWCKMSIETSTGDQYSKWLLFTLTPMVNCIYVNYDYIGTKKI